MIPDSYCTLDHDGCVVCSDAGIPVRVVSVEGEDALCEDSAGNRAGIAVELVAPVRIGELLLTHGGVAIGRVGRESGRAEIPAVGVPPSGGRHK